MSKSLADLRAAPPQARPERSVAICLRPDLVGEVQILTGRLNEVETRIESSSQPSDEPRRQGQGEADEVKALRAEAAEIRARLAELLDEMGEFEGEMRLRANRTDGEWRRWVNEHPARGEGQPGYDRDQRVTYGVCDADSLLDDLGTYAHAWNSDPLTDGDFSRIFEPNIATADKAQMAQAVVTMYESRLDFHLLRSSLSANLARSNGSASPAPSASLTPVSTDVSPEPSSVVTTVTESESA